MTQPSASQGSGLTDTELRASPVAVSGTFWPATQPVSGTFWQATQPVSGTFWQATQPVSGPLTDTQLRAAAVPVSGTFWQTTQPVSASSAFNPATAYGKTITYVAVNQSAAGTTQLAAASGSNKHKVVGAVLTLSVAGTLKFTDSNGDLTGPMDIAASGGFVVPTGILPIAETGAVNRALSIVTTGGAARGVVALVTEP